MPPAAARHWHFYANATVDRKIGQKTMNAPLLHNISGQAAISDDALGLTRIFEPAIQIAEWRRPPDPAIVHWLERHAGDLGSGLRQILRPGDRPQLAHWPAGPGREALADDLALLAEILGELLAADHVGLRLEVVDQAMCPRLHVDRVGIRLLCTYRGPGTEWVDDSGIDRRLLGAAAAGKPDECSGLLLSGHRIERLAPFSVALLKGQHWQGNGDRGIVHRSPPVTPACAPRILVALDAAWTD